MTTYTLANLDEWAAKSARRADIVVAQSTNDLIEMASRTAPGVMRGGKVIPGYIPRDTGFLAASMVSSLNGSTTLAGKDSHIFVVANMKAGDRATFGWTAAYARRLHYNGWLWVDSAVPHWSSIVADVIERAKRLAP